MSFAVNHLVGFGARRASVSTQVVTWNPSDKSASVTLSNADMDAERAAGTSWVAARATLGRSTGLFYYELDVITASSPNIIAGFMSAGATLYYPGSSASGAGLRRTSKHSSGWTESNATTPGGTDANGDRWMFAANLNNGKLWCGVNGVWTSGDPAADTTPWITSVSGTIYPAVGIYTGSGKVRLVVDAVSMLYLPSGFSAWNLA